MIGEEDTPLDGVPQGDQSLRERPGHAFSAK